MSEPGGGQPAPLYGLVLLGDGVSKTQADVTTPERDGVLPVARLYDLLDAHCEFVFVSIRKEQADWPALKRFPQIFDAFAFDGPMNGLLSAMQAGPLAAWLAVAWPSPQVGARIVEHLIINRNPDKLVTAFVDTRDALPEPLCAIYEPAARRFLIKAAADGVFSLRETLIRNVDGVELLPPLEENGALGHARLSVGKKMK